MAKKSKSKKRPKAKVKKTVAKKSAAKKTKRAVKAKSKAVAKKSAKKVAKKAAKKSTTRKYSPGAGKQVKREMDEMKAGKLKSGRSGKKVTNPKQAIAIALSEARKKGAKVPPNPNK